MTERQRKRLLSDHKKSEKKLVPPITSQFGDRLQLTSWPRTGIAELVWLALLHEQDEEFGVRAADKLAKIARSALPTSKMPFCLISHFASVGATEGAVIWAQLPKDDQVILSSALQPLIAGYPTCPLNRVVPSTTESPQLERLKRVLDSVFNKTSRESTMALATMLYITVHAGMLFLHPESRLLHMEAIRDYPTTDHSKLMASELRSLTIMGFMPPQYEEHPWPKEFWNRGLELELCTYE
jgi:hypothetical protein